jgi:hypothetical protein
LSLFNLLLLKFPLFGVFILSIEILDWVSFLFLGQEYLEFSVLIFLEVVILIEKWGLLLFEGFLFLFLDSLISSN